MRIPSNSAHRLGPSVRASFAVLSAAVLAFPQIGFAFPFRVNEVEGFFDTSVSIGNAWRVEGRNADLVGIANGGRAFTVNGDDGNLHYDDGDSIARVARLTHDLGLRYRNYGAFVRGTYFYDDVNASNGDLTEDQRHRAGRRAELLDAYVHAEYEPFGRSLAVRLGNQVVSWGESTFIQNGISITNTFDVTRLRQPGSELREAFKPSPLAWASVDLLPRLSLEGYYLFDFDRIELDVCGTFFATTDIACEKPSQPLTTGFGMAPEGAPGFVSSRLGTDEARDDGQFGVALRYLFEHLNETEVGLYYLNYHSHYPYLNTVAVAPNVTPNHLFEYPEDIHLIGGSLNAMLGATGVAFQGEYSHRTNLPLAVDGFEVFAAAQFAPFSQIRAASAPGEEIKGYRRFDVGQWQGTLTKSWGPRNPFWADDWLFLAEAGATKVYGMPDKNDLRLEGPGTELPGAFVPMTPGTQESGFGDAFSWGYVLSSRVTYHRVIGAMNLTPGIAFSHDVNGTTPSPIGNFVEHRRAFTASLKTDYLNSYFTELAYTRFYGAEKFNALYDRDFVSVTMKFAY